MTPFESEPSNLSPRRKPKPILRRTVKGLAWAVGGLFAIALLAAVLLVTLVNVDGVHRYLIGIARQRATAALGVPVDLKNFRLDIPKLRVDLYGITIDGASPYPTPPLFRANHIAASVRIVSILHLKWYLNSVEIDHPVAWIVQGEHGESNFPKIRSSGGTSRFNLVDLAIRHFVLDRGEILFNDHPHSLQADLRDLRLGAGYDSVHDGYDGNIAYRDGRIKLDTVRPVVNKLEANFRLQRDALYMNQAALAIGSSRVSLAGILRNFDRPEISVQYDAVINGAQVQSLLATQQIPSGVIETSGSVQYRSLPSKSPLETLKIAGTASSKTLWVKMSSLNTAVKEITCQYSYSSGIATLRNLRAKALGGEIEAQGMEKALGSGQHGSLKIVIRRLSLAESERALKLKNQAPGLSGQLNATAFASWGKTFKDLKANIDASLKGSVTSRGNNTGLLAEASSNGTLPGSIAGKSIVPILGEFHATYTQENGRLQLRNSYLQTPGASLVMNGATGKDSSLSIRLQSGDLGELASLASTFAPQANAGGSLNVSGKGSFQGSISGAITNPQIRGNLIASDLVVNGSRWRSVRAGIGLSASGFRLENAILQPASRGKIEIDAQTSLNHWSFNKAEKIQASLSASNLKMASFLKLANPSLPVDGTLSANLRIRGTLANPEGNGKVVLTDATAYRQPVRSATVSFSTLKGEIKCDGDLEIAGGNIRASGSVEPAQRTFRGQIQSSGIRVDQIAFLKSRNVKAGGDLMLNVSGHGSFDNPEMNGAVKISQAAIEGRNLSAMDLQVSLSNQILDVDLSSLLADAPLKSHARVALTGKDLAQVSLETGKLPLKPLLALYAPEMADEIDGQAQVHLVLRGPLKDRQALVGEITVPVLAVSYGNKVQLAATAPIHANYQNGSLHVQPTAIHGTDTDLQLQGTIPLYSQTPMALQASGTVNLQIAELLIPDLQSSGSAHIDIHAQNATSGGGLGGTIDITNANVRSASFPTGLENGNGTLTLNDNRIDISKFNGNVGGGTVTAQGGVTLQPKLGFDLGLTAKDVQVLYPQGVRESVNANIRFSGSTEQALLGGTVGIADVSFTPAFDLMSMVGQFSNGVSAPTAPGFTQNVNLNVAIHSTNTLSPSSRTMSVTGTAEMFVRGTMAHPSLVGRVNLTGGNMIFHGDRFVLTGGTIQFADPNVIRPVLNVSLTTTIQQYDINLRFRGPADQLQGEYTSNPSLPRADVISLLAFGTTTEAQASNRTPANQAAESLIASQVSSQVTSRISKIAGISQLSISPVLTGGTAAGPPGAVITVRQQITGNLFVTFSTNVASTQSEVVQGEYKLSPRVAVSATRDPNGGFAVDTLIRKSW